MTVAQPSAGDTPLVHKPGRLSRRESRLAFGMTLPSVFMVMAIVLFPLLATFWISVKPIELADLRAPEVRAREQVRGDATAAGDEIILRYKLRNSSRDKEVLSVRLSDVVPAGLTPSGLDARCQLAVDRVLSCDLGDFEPGQSETLDIPVQASQGFIDNPVNAKDSDVSVSGSSVNPLLTMELTLDNFRRVFAVREFGTVLWTTFVYTIGGTAGALILGLFAALLLNQSFAGRAVFRGFLLYPFVAPVIAAAFTWVVLLDPFSGSLNALLMQMGAVDAPINFFGVRSVDVQIFGLTVPVPMALSVVIAFEAWRYFPLSFLFILARMQSIPQDMYEAADMDGASPFQKFWALSLPQLVGIMAVLFLLRFIWTFNKFDDIFLLTGGNAGTRTLTVQVYEQAFALSNLGAGAAVAVLVFVLLAVFATIYFRAMPEEEGL
ncbi:sugar ABC transporter permease [Alphaproteobacteria bacterium]|nr:sugar ABC transporter permease [Alphaproteobacteria bacterium]